MLLEAFRKNRVNKMKPYVVGIDVGGTEVKMGLFKDGLLEDWHITTNKQDGGGRILIETAASIWEKCRERDIDRTQILGFGIGVPGPVIDSRKVLGCVNLGWGDVDVAGETARFLAAKFGGSPSDFTVRAANDANMAVLGEVWKGGARSCSNVVMVTLGTGVGGGIVIDGKIFDGSAGSAGEIGHIHCVDKADILGKCTCGNEGCLEQIASARGIAAYARNCLKASERPSLLREYLKEKGHLTARDVTDAGKSGDEMADAVMDRVALYLGRGIASVCAVLDPELILIGGGVSRAGEYLRKKIEISFRSQAFPTMKNTPVELAKLGNLAGITGAAYRIISEFNFDS